MYFYNCLSFVSGFSPLELRIDMKNSQMTKSNYELIGGVIANNYSGEGKDIKIYLLAQELAKAFKANDPRFDRTKFLQACGILPTPPKNGYSLDGGNTWVTND